MNNCILTAASEKYFISLQGLIASVRLNWSKTIPIIVYDLGLSKENIDLLATVGNLHVRAIPEFCPHWRKYYTWKLWAMSTVESDVCIWLDAGIFVLGSLDNVLDVTQRQGLFLIPNYQSLANEAPHAAVYSTGLTYAEITNRSSISANIIGFSRHNAYYEVIQKVLN